jgi:hypothetical protein
MPRGLRLRDYLAGRTGPPPHSRDAEVEDLIRRIEAMDEVDVEEIARLCACSHARVWERVETILREEGGRGE